MTETITLEIDGDGDVEKFKRDLVKMANGDPDWSVSVIGDDGQ